VDFVIKIDGLSSVLTGAAPDTYLMIKGFPYEPDFTSTSFPVSNYATPSMPLVSLKAVGFGGVGGALGSIQVYPGQVAPSGWRICDGSSLSKNNYSGLYNALGGSSSPYGSDDGFASTFKLPDLRGLFVRGYGSNGTNPATSGAFAQYQSDELKSHTHTYQYPGSESFTGSKFNSAKYDSPGIRTTTATGGDETRPQNIALNYIIYVGSSGSGSGDIAGAFVVDNSETRFYLYGSSGNISVTDLPVGGVVSYIHGSFSYFTNSVTKYLGTTPPPPPPGGGGGTPPGGGGTPPPPPTRTTPAITNLEVVGQNLVLSYSGVDSDASGLDVYTSTGNNYTFILAENVGGNTASGTRSYVIPQATTYFKIKTVYPDNTRSADSNIEYYVYSAPEVINRSGTITEQGQYLRIDLQNDADCGFNGTIYGQYTATFGYGGGSFNAPFSISAGSRNTTAAIYNEYGSTIELSSYYISDISTYQSSQCNGAVYLTLTPN
jgi:microcystin-dependent protein